MLQDRAIVTMAY